VINLVAVIAITRSSQYFHEKPLDKLLGGTMFYFDTQPTGRIINRFSGDMDLVDTRLNRFTLFMISSFNVLGTFTVLGITSIWILFTFLPFAIILTLIVRLQVPFTREILRYNSLARSPLNSYLSDHLAGLSTIRAFNAQKKVLKRFHAFNDESNIPRYTYAWTVGWLKFRTDCLSVGVLSVACGFVASGILSPVLVGLVLSYATLLPDATTELLTVYSEMQQPFVAIERLEVYRTLIPQEPPRTLPSDPSPTEWPTNGTIEIKDLEVRYESRKDTPALSNLTLSIASGEKVGLVGRTGSGKSTILTALLRLVEPSHGSVIIDGKNTKDLGLHTLRKGLFVISQEPFLFEGTLRSNVDVEGNVKSDAEIWDALEHVGMKEYVQSLPEKLDAPVSAQGDNFSVGQRQLICLCRAVLRKPKILVMDEATASIDSATDEKLQEVIKTLFAETTVISIAHRLNTVADFDKVVVLGDGKVVEKGSPYELLQDAGSQFAMLTEASGAANAEIIRKTALARHMMKMGLVSE
ncbi:Multidrug resistance-associated protein 5, partial [Chytridiales sp. JEL 0842]